MTQDASPSGPMRHLAGLALAAGAVLCVWGVFRSAPMTLFFTPLRGLDLLITFLCAIALCSLADRIWTGLTEFLKARRNR